MSSINSKLLEFFTHIPKLDIDGSNWVIFKDRFLFAAAAAGLKEHVKDDGKPPSAEPPIAHRPGQTLTDEQKEALREYQESVIRWEMEESIVKQALASVIPDSLFIEVRKQETVLEMWNAVKNQREKKSRMVTVDMRRKLQSEKCGEHDDVRTHLVKLQTM